MRIVLNSGRKLEYLGESHTEVELNPQTSSIDCFAMMPHSGRVVAQEKQLLWNFTQKASITSKMSYFAAGWLLVWLFALVLLLSLPLEGCEYS